MKILLGADQYPEYINGAATFTARLAAGLAGAGHTIDLLWPSDAGERQTFLDRRVRVHRLSSIALPRRPRIQLAHPRVVRRQVAQILEVARPDVVHVQSHLTLGRALVYAAKAAGPFAMPGTAQLQSIATLEAMAAGLPVVAVDAMALPHLVHHGENGYLHRPGDVDDLAERMRSLLTDPRLADFGLRSRDLAQQHDITTTLTTFIELYARIAGSRKPATVDTTSIASSFS